MPMGKKYASTEAYNKYVAMNKSDWGKGGSMKSSDKKKKTKSYKSDKKTPMKY